MKTRFSSTPAVASRWIPALWLGLLVTGVSTQAQGIRTATAKVEVLDGYVLGVTLMDGGSGYGVAPKVTLSGGSGSGAAVVAKVRNGAVGEIVLVNAGSGYSAQTVVGITPPEIPMLESVHPGIGLVIHGRSGEMHQILATDVLMPSAWRVVADVLVTNSPYMWVGRDEAFQQRYYRVAGGMEAPVLEQARLVNELTIQGTVGTTNWVLAREWEVQGGAWRVLTNVLLTSSPCVWVDETVSTLQRRYQVSTRPEVPEGAAGEMDARSWVWIQPGRFTMGSPPDEEDRHSWEGPQTVVTLTKGFWMRKHEVTQGEYLEVMGSNPSYFRGDPNRPVEQVSWIDATNYCARLTERERAAGRLPAGNAYRLPTAAEWEYACRAGTSTRFSYGDDPSYANLTKYAWCSANTQGSTRPVGKKVPNPWGLYDMYGNVWEWCQDFGAAHLPGGSTVDPQGPATGPDRVVRGGDYFNSGGYCRSATSDALTPDTWGQNIGFRIVLSPGQT